MIDHAVAFTPFGLAASPEMIMAGFGFHDAHIAGGESLHTGIAMPLGKAAASLAPAMVAEDCSGIGERHRLSDPWIHAEAFVANWQGVFDDVA